MTASPCFHLFVYLLLEKLVEIKIKSRRHWHHKLTPPPHFFSYLKRLCCLQVDPSTKQNSLHSLLPQQQNDKMEAGCQTKNKIKKIQNTQKIFKIYAQEENQEWSEEEDQD